MLILSMISLPRSIALTVVLIIVLQMVNVSPVSGQVYLPDHHAPHEARQQRTEQGSSGTNFWIHYSRGLSTLGAATSAGLAFEFNRHVLSLRTASTDTSPVNDTWDLAILYGRGMRAGTVYLSGGIGASVIAGEQYSRLLGGTSKGTMDPMLAFPLEGHLAWPLSKYFSFGIYTFINVNTVQPIGGITASIRLGRMP